MQNKILSPKVLLPTGIVAAVFVAVMRIAEYKLYYNSSTGILKGSYIFTIVALVVIAALTAGIVLLTLKDKGEFKINTEKNMFSAVMSAVSALVTLFSAVGIFSLWMGYKTGAIYSYGGTEGSFLFPLAVFSVLEAVFLIFSAYDAFSSGEILKKKPLFGLVPTLWGLVFLLYLFANDTTYIVKSENYYILLGAVACLSSVLCFVRAFVFEDTGKRAKLIYAAAFCALALALGYAFSELYFFFTGFARLKSMPISVSLTYLSVGLFEMGTLARLKK